MAGFVLSLRPRWWVAGGKRFAWVLRHRSIILLGRLSERILFSSVLCLINPFYGYSDLSEQSKTNLVCKQVSKCEVQLFDIHKAITSSDNCSMDSNTLIMYVSRLITWGSYAEYVLKDGLVLFLPFCKYKLMFSKTAEALCFVRPISAGRVKQVYMHRLSREVILARAVLQYL